MRPPDPRLVGPLALCALLALLAGGCAGPTEQARPAEQVRPSEVPQRITALGVASAKDVSLARRIAEARAIKGLARLMEPDAIQFDYRASQGDSTLELSLGPTEVQPESTEFIDKIKTSWVARASATRSQAAVAAMQALSGYQARASASHPDPAVCLMRAESRALREVISAALSGDPGDVHLTGSLTLKSLTEQITAESATVEVEAHVKVQAQTALDAEAKRAVFEEALKEYRSLQEWPRAIGTLERLLALGPASAARLTELGELHGYVDQHLQAADAFARAAELEPANLEHLRAELAAAKRIPDAARVVAVEQKLREAEQKAKAADQAKPPAAKPEPATKAKPEPKAKPRAKSKPKPKASKKLTQ